MKNSFNINIDNHILRSTDDYHIMAEVVRVDDGAETQIFAWYREESGFSFRFSVEDPWGGNPQNAVVFAKLFHILVKIIDYFMLEENEHMALGAIMGSLPESVKKILDLSGLSGQESPEEDLFYFAEEEFGEHLDKDDRSDYNDDHDDYFHDDRDDGYGYEDFED